MAKKKSTRPTAKRKVAKPAAKKKPAVRPKKAAPKVKLPSLGRPTVTQEEKLFLLFREDYHARQIFEFLRAETVRDLEQFSPDEIVRQLSQPIKQSVQRIRVKLAQHNRCLREDEEFAREHSGDEQPT